jgi:hypothetical protein
MASHPINALYFRVHSDQHLTCSFHLLERTRTYLSAQVGRMNCRPVVIVPVLFPVNSFSGPAAAGLAFLRIAAGHAANQGGMENPGGFEKLKGFAMPRR